MSTRLSYVKTLSYNGGHVGFQTGTKKNVHLKKDLSQGTSVYAMIV